MRFVLFLLLSLPLSAATFKSHDGTVLHYDVVGKGERIVLLSGGPGFSPEYLRPVAEKLSDKYAFVLLHQRGTGKSAVEKHDGETLALKNLVGDLEALRKELKSEKLCLVGHSFGGILSMMYAREYPERVAMLALVDSGGPTLKSVLKFNANLESRFSEEDRARIKEWSDPERVKENRRRAVLELTRAKTSAYFADRAKAQPFMAALTEESFNDQMFRAVVPQMFTLDLRAGLEKVTAPILILHGKQDPLETAEELRETFPKAKVELLDNAGHFPWAEQPGAFYAALGGFLADAGSCH
ncbi:MAG TPA: alpha/beta hydrolase [Thermoanaerobaculia bacterium]|nr:alpha/beta hydrolase [Thermoanaerobaculia bacterium]